MTEREKMLRGEQFETLDPQLSEDRRRGGRAAEPLNALSMDASGTARRSASCCLMLRTNA